ncbi:hypothetical protein M3697_15895 [Janibacter melonis]|uniref:DUF6801 domain-containing protein n=1 Tax=Janibacter melonis TaxID=262209 RepID=UPI002044446E|nr:DUF6801 domain-containing protein [Janibacter melonis]MCM3556568.1 hypothetical protein [Janibacter melonis]
MARRHVRTSAGAAALPGLGIAAVGLAAPAQAVTITQDYECTYEVLNLGQIAGDPDVSVSYTIDLPTSVEEGEQITSDVTAVVTIPESRRDSLYSLLNVRAVDAPSDPLNAAGVSGSDGTDSVDGDIAFTSPLTDVPASGELVVTATGSLSVPAPSAGTYDVEATDLTAFIRGYADADGQSYTTNVTLRCTNVSESTSVGTIEVTEADSEPTPTTDEPTTDEPTTDEPTTDEPTSEDPDPTTSSDPTATSGSPTSVQTPALVQTDASQGGSGQSPALLLGGGLLAAVGGLGLTLTRRRASARH